jgi:hypothetical protein
MGDLAVGWIAAGFVGAPRDRRKPAANGGPNPPGSQLSRSECLGLTALVPCDDRQLPCFFLRRSGQNNPGVAAARTSRTTAT